MKVDESIGGYVANEVERIRVLSKEFVVYAFVLISLSNLMMVRAYTNIWFKGVNARITVLPYVNVYGARILSRVAAGTIVGFSIVLLHLSKGVDLIISRDSAASIPVLLASKIAHVRFLYNALSVPFGYRETKLLGGYLMRGRGASYAMMLIDYFVLQKANYVGVATRDLDKELLAVFGRNYQRKVIILPFPVAEEFFSCSLEVRPKSDVHLVYGGSVYGLYDFSHLVEALDAMARAGQGVSMAIYTREKGRQRLRGLVSERSFVTVRDYVQRERLITILRDATAVVIPLSVGTPGISRKAVEAMALGTPVIISNPPDDGIFRDGETCVVVSENTAEGWRSAIMRVVVPEFRERIIRGAREEAEAFRSARNVEAIAGLLRNLP